MEHKNTQDRPQQQTAENPSERSGGNPFENKQTVEQDLEQAGEALDNEQQFKEAQTERD